MSLPCLENESSSYESYAKSGADGETIPPSRGQYVEIAGKRPGWDNKRHTGRKDTPYVESHSPIGPSPDSQPNYNPKQKRPDNMKNRPSRKKINENFDLPTIPSDMSKFNQNEFGE